MQLELLNDQGQATSKVDAPDTVFARDYNEALVQDPNSPYAPEARQRLDELKRRTQNANK